MRKADPTVIAGLRVSWREVPYPASDSPPGKNPGVAFGLWTVVDPDGLLDLMSQEEYEQTDERMPYFAMIWDSGELLAESVLAGPPLDGLRVLDLGCGLGICGLAAASRGGHVTFFDWEARAIEITAASVREQPALATRCDFVVGDWRRAPPTLGAFDHILGADVLYERRNVEVMAEFLSAHLKPGGESWFTDPGRPQARQFPPLAAARGLLLLSEETPVAQPYDPAITLLRFRKSPPTD